RYISPTKTPEYLAAGVPVVSTPIHDVIKPYGVKNLVHISGHAKGFITSIELELSKKDKRDWLQQVELHLKDLSWDNTYQEMQEKIRITLENLNTISVAS